MRFVISSQLQEIEDSGPCIGISARFDLLCFSGKSVNFRYTTRL